MEYRHISHFVCANCDIAIVGPPVTHVGLPFCCAGCVVGGPCRCSYDEPLGHREQTRLPAQVHLHECHDLTTITEAPEPAREPVLAGR
jgi:hypothetical protein